PDWELRAQIAVWIISTSITLPIDTFTYLYMQRSCEAVDAAGLQFVPTYGRPPHLSATLHEKLSVLSQIIYFENFLFLTHGGAEPTMSARIEKEFRHQLPVRNPLVIIFPRPQYALTGSLSNIVQNLSVDHAHKDDFAG